jgi:nitrogen fixation NifU-like protein
MPDAQATASNPLCGESVTVTLSLDLGQPDPRVTDIRFQSDGCSISQASASMMTDLVRGKSEAEILSLARALQALLRGDLSELGALGPLRILGSVARLPSRVACALLPWDALRRALDSATLPPAAA